MCIPLAESIWEAVARRCTQEGQTGPGPGVLMRHIMRHILQCLPALRTLCCVQGLLDRAGEIDPNDPRNQLLMEASIPCIVCTAPLSCPLTPLGERCGP